MWVGGRVSVSCLGWVHGLAFCLFFVHFDGEIGFLLLNNREFDENLVWRTLVYCFLPLVPWLLLQKKIKGNYVPESVASFQLLL
jgi:hypothetical protein